MRWQAPQEVLRQLHHLVPGWLVRRPPVLRRLQELRRQPVRQRAPVGRAGPRCHCAE